MTTQCCPVLAERDGCCVIAEQVVAESANPGTVARSAGIDANEMIGLCNSTFRMNHFSRHSINHSWRSVKNSQGHIAIVAG
ncbi:hypothetical protein [Burkholderia gladioli]|uniref:hypothetical protein n=1 Tax=Burkholderia gladioli TaxID=28095 RepID=UPI001640C294|nr:hypothetical protein [Burkholderia gladioli]